MWNEEPSKIGCTSLRYLRDEDTCSFCKSHTDESNYPGTYCHNPPEFCNSSLAEVHGGGLIRIHRDLNEDYTWIILYEIVPGSNNFGERDKVELWIYPQDNYGEITKEWVGAYYDPTLSLQTRAEDVEKIVKALPLLNQPKLDLEEILGLNGLNLFEDKSAWIEAYHDFFDLLRGFLNKKAEIIPPLADSPLLPLYEAFMGKSD